jgi:hypothetical protein
MRLSPCRVWPLIALVALIFIGPGIAHGQIPPQTTGPRLPDEFAKPTAITMAELAKTPTQGVSVVEVSDYVFGGYKGKFPSPPHADMNARRAFIIRWKDFSYRFVFSHEGSYCPWFEFPSGDGICFQFFEGNDGWAELFNDWGRKERNSFVDVIENGPKRVWIHWTYFGVNQDTNEAAYRGTEDFWAYPNGLVLRRQTYESLKPKDHHGYTREPIETICMCPVGKLWKDILRKDPKSEERHCLTVVDAFSDKRYDDYWTPKPGTLWDSTRRRAGSPWRELDDAKGVALILPLIDGSPFCIFGDASGYRHDYTRIKEHSFPDTGGSNWGSMCWDHWPVGWLNSQAHNVDATSLRLYPNHFSPMGMDFFALPDAESARGVFYSLYGVGGKEVKPIRDLARRWLDKGAAAIAKADSGADLPAFVSRGELPPAAASKP